MSVEGTYNIAIQSPMGEQKGQLTVAASGDGFTGTVSNPMMGTMDVLDGKIDGDKLTWKMDMKVPMPMTLDCEATVSGDAISGKVVAGAFGALALSGTRA
jgi:hypothetical protein